MFKIYKADFKLDSVTDRFEKGSLKNQLNITKDDKADRYRGRMLANLIYFTGNVDKLINPVTIFFANNKLEYLHPGQKRVLGLMLSRKVKTIPAIAVSIYPDKTNLDRWLDNIEIYNENIDGKLDLMFRNNQYELNLPTHRNYIDEEDFDAEYNYLKERFKSLNWFNFNLFVDKKLKISYQFFDNQQTTNVYIKDDIVDYGNLIRYIAYGDSNLKTFKVKSSRKDLND